MIIKLVRDNIISTCCGPDSNLSNSLDNTMKSLIYFCLLAFYERSHYVGLELAV